ncbi:MAG: hypothetical protein WBO32_09705, partial [Cyclobacteriaceae bacterium]
MLKTAVDRPKAQKKRELCRFPIWLVTIKLAFLTALPTFAEDFCITRKSNRADIVEVEQALLSMDRPTQSEEAAECRKKFDEYNCQEKIDSAQPQDRTKYLDCESGASQQVIKACMGYGIIGFGTGYLAAMVPYLAVPATLAYGGYLALEKDKECFYDHERKRNLLRPVTALYGAEFSETWVQNLGCSAISEKTYRITQKISAVIYQKEWQQERYLAYLGKSPSDSRIKAAERRIPKSSREITPAEKNFKEVISKIEDEKEELQSIIQKVTTEFPCYSGGHKAKLICGIAGSTAGGVAGLIRGAASANSQNVVKVVPGSGTIAGRSIQNINELRGFSRPLNEIWSTAGSPEHR